MAAKVLLADFQYLTRKGISNLIKAIPGLDLVAELEDAVELESAVLKATPELAIVDLYGHEESLLAQIERTKASTNTSFLVISNSQNRDSIQRLLSAGVKGILTKNCSEEEITNGLIAVSKGSRFFCNTILEMVVQGESDELDCEPSNLTKREYEVLELIAKGKSTAQIADSLCLSIHTINSHRKNILKKMNLNSPAELIVHALETGLVKP